MRNRLQNKLLEKYAAGFQAACDLLGVSPSTLIKAAKESDEEAERREAAQRRRDQLLSALGIAGATTGALGLGYGIYRGIKQRGLANNPTNQGAFVDTTLKLQAGPADFNPNPSKPLSLRPHVPSSDHWLGNTNLRISPFSASPRKPEVPIRDTSHLYDDAGIPLFPNMMMDEEMNSVL